MASLELLASAILGMATILALNAETGCPGNVSSTPFRLVNQHQMIVPVSVNHLGPYDFLLDTGTQATIIDRGLAAELHLETSGRAVITGTGSRQAASYVQLDLLETGSVAVPNQTVLVYDLQRLQVADLRIRGILGEAFLEHFDMLIDSAHHLLCLDDSGALRANVRGPHTTLLGISKAAAASNHRI